MKYCIKCVQPDTRPNVYFNEQGLCGACIWEEEKSKVDWKARKEELVSICDWAKSQKSPYDCIIGVSGGKDSTFQALFMRDEMKMHPLLVCSEPAEITPIGFKNIENIKNLGFDVLTLSPNRSLIKKFFKKDFYKFGNPDRASEYCLHASVFIIANKFDIPLIVNGENPGQTLGISNMAAAEGDASKIWLSNTVKDNPIDLYKEDAELSDLFLYKPDMEAIKRKNIRAVWLSNYVKDWGQLHNAQFSLKNGLSIYAPPPDGMNPYDKGFYRRFSSLDHSFREVIQLLKYIKFGFGFTTDQACYDIRDNQISREEGIFLVKELDGNCSPAYIEKFCRLINITTAEFWEVADSFRGDMWAKENNKWRLIDPIWEQFPIQGQYSVKKIMERLKI